MSLLKTWRWVGGDPGSSREPLFSLPVRGSQSVLTKTLDGLKECECAQPQAKPWGWGGVNPASTVML